MANKKSFARVRQRSKYRRMRREEERNWKITAPIVKEDGTLGGNRPLYDDGNDVPFYQYNFSEREFIREMNRSWNRRKK